MPRSRPKNRSHHSRRRIFRQRAGCRRRDSIPKASASGRRVVRVASMRPRSRGKWRHGESNSRHSACKADALPTELCPLKTPVYLSASLPRDSEKARRSWLFQVGPDGLEPSTFALSERRSNQLSYEPWHTLADQGWRIVGEHPRPGKGEFHVFPNAPPHMPAGRPFALVEPGCSPDSPIPLSPGSSISPLHRESPKPRRVSVPGSPELLRPLRSTGLGVTGSWVESDKNRPSELRIGGKLCKAGDSTLNYPIHDTGKEGDPE